MYIYMFVCLFLYYVFIYIYIYIYIYMYIVHCYAEKNTISFHFISYRKVLKRKCYLETQVLSLMRILIVNV